MVTSILKLKPACKNYIWGGNQLISEYHKEFNQNRLAETWELSCHSSGMSTICKGTYDGKTLYEYIISKGRKVLGSNCGGMKSFPILIKFIDAEDNLSIQVHPSDKYAVKKEKEYGKTEMWYVVDCKEDSSIYYGFSKDISKEEVKERINNNTILDVLNRVSVSKGDAFFIEPGTIHSIGKGIIMAEIQQNSNITYRVYDYDRVDSSGNKRELHIDKALDVLNLCKINNNKKMYPHIAKCRYFTVDRLYLNGDSLRSASGIITEKTFISILIIDGNGIIYSDFDSFEYKKGDSFFIPAGKGVYTIEGRCEALITTV